MMLGNTRVPRRLVHFAPDRNQIHENFTDVIDRNLPPAPAPIQRTARAPKRYTKAVSIHFFHRRFEALAGLVIAA